MEAASSTFLGLSAHGWTALGTVALVLATMALAGVTLGLLIAGLRQIRAIREENRKSATLHICTCYETNPVIARAVRVLWKARLRDDLEKNAKRYRPHFVVLLNYLDGIAIGVEQGIYIEDLAWDHMEAIVAVNVRSYIDSGIIERAGMFKENYGSLLKMRDRWAEARPRFEERDGRRVEQRGHHA
jgi:hypothetical protein